MLTELYPWTKTLHVISMVAWMAGLFYLPRLYVHHAERGGSPGEPSDSFKLMEAKLLGVIMNPAMAATWGFGLLLAVTPGVVDWRHDLWIYVKLATVLGLSGFHLWLAGRRRDFAADRNTVSGRRYRLLNEVPTLALFVIVVMVIVKPW